MSVKSNLLLLLEQNRGRPVSGQRISEQLGVTRGAVWKAVKELRQQGYQIQAVTNRGYTLDDQNDILSPQGILPYVEDAQLAERITVLESVPSTNTLLKQQAAEGAPAPSALIAKEQTGGRGRRGRSFYSPKNSGLYVSLLLRPQGMMGDHAPLITTAAAVAVCQAVEEVCGVSLQIKWVNDLFLGEQKICGILTEAVTDFESGCVESVIIGVGMNLIRPEGLPQELVGVAGYLSDALERPVSRNRLCAAVLNHLMRTVSQLQSRAFLPEYRRRSLVLGRTVQVASPQGEYTAKALDIGENGDLVVSLDDGTRRRLSSGEVRISPVASPH